MKDPIEISASPTSICLPQSSGVTVSGTPLVSALVTAMTNPVDISPDHRLLAAESALKDLYAATGLMGISAKFRDEAVNRYLVSQGKARVSRDTIRRAMRRLRERGAADK